MKDLTIPIKLNVGAIVTYKIYGDADNTCTVAITQLDGVRFYGDRIDNGINVWGFRRHILPSTIKEATK